MRTTCACALVIAVFAAGCGREDPAKQPTPTTEPAGAIEPPKPGETIRAFSLRAEEAGDTLFLFLCREANDEIEAHEYVTRLERAMQDIAAVHQVFLAEAASCSRRGAASGPGALTRP